MEERWRLRSGEDWLDLNDRDHRVVPKRLRDIPREVLSHPDVTSGSARMQAARLHYHNTMDDEFASMRAIANARQAYGDAHRDMQDAFERVSQEFLAKHEVWVYGPRIDPSGVLWRGRR